jgi:hypothetical protein
VIYNGELYNFREERRLLAERGLTLHDLDVLSCASGCRIPIIQGIPRFVESAGYAADSRMTCLVAAAVCPISPV